jgi:phenylalanyl-tRNA synthetase beta chain
MKVSLKWLNEFVQVDDVDPKLLANKLTFAGVEVESVDPLASATNLVIGKILSCEKHPDSDHLHVLKVDEGPKHGVHQIVCGAPNARAGLKVIVAREGAVLPLVTIQKSDIRGVESDGMCCALYELGVDKKYLSEKQVSGIEELPEDAEIGNENVLGYLGLDDTVLDLDLLPSRSDLNAIVNVAAEVACLLERPLKLPKVPSLSEKKSDFVVGSTSPKCPYFGAEEVYGVVTKPSPLWLQRILTAEGVRSINNIVDIGNYVMLLTGQPLNMYDLDKLPKRELIVKDDHDGDFLAMDEKHYALQKGDLLVTSADQGMCLAGIMTSKACAVDALTKNVVIEAAIFNGAAIRHTSNRLGLASESSSRFVKGLNPFQQKDVLALSASLLKDLAEAKEIREPKIYASFLPERKVIPTSLGYINSRLGTSFSLEEIRKVLTRDHLVIENEQGENFSVLVPPYRVDMGGEADVSEEVIRLLGYDQIQSKLPDVSLSIGGGMTLEQKNKVAIRSYLRGEGLDECLTYSLIDGKHVDSFAYLVNGETYRLKNPMTDDHEVMRKNLLYSLLSVASYNYAHQEKDLALFEISDIDTPKVKTSHLAIVLVGQEDLQSSLLRRPYDFYSVKGLFEGMMALLSINENRYKILPLASDKEEFHPGRSAGIYLGKTLVGVMGELHPNALKAYDIGKVAAVLEIDLPAFLSLRSSPDKAVVPAKFPSLSRDLAFLLPKSVNYEDVKREIAHTDKLIASIEIFDLYEGANIAPDKKSMALSLSFQDPDRTLKDEEVNVIMQKIIGTLQMRFNAEIRQ